jgi:hypothetical protein
MKKDELQTLLKDLENQIRLAEARLDALSKENAFLRELVHHLASRPSPYFPSMPSPKTEPWPKVEKTTMGCQTCGIGSDGRAYGYVCSRSDCPTRVTC